MAAARAGKHVVIEKPLSVTLEEADEMIAACRQHGRKLMYAEELCFAPKYERIRHLVKELASHNVQGAADPSGSCSGADDGHFPFPFRVQEIAHGFRRFRGRDQRSVEPQAIIGLVVSDIVEPVFPFILTSSG